MTNDAATAHRGGCAYPPSNFRQTLITDVQLSPATREWVEKIIAKLPSELKQTKERVLKVLSQHPDARASDKKLIDWFIHYYGDRVPHETITRCRRYWLNTIGIYQPSAVVKTKRRVAQNIIRRIFRGVENGKQERIYL